MEMDPFLNIIYMESSSYRNCQTYEEPEATTPRRTKRARSYDQGQDGGPSNNDVLGMAFFSFLGFTIVQTSFAIRAKSSAMIADSSAMFVDAGTYLCNMLAERLKSRPITEEEERLSPSVLEYKLKLQRLYLELFPPLLSVITLLYVTFTTFDKAVTTLLSDLSAVEGVKSGDQPNLRIMMVFSFMNLLLDIVNVTCFARVNQAIMTPVNFETKTETSKLLSIEETLATEEASSEDEDMSDDELLNLNMCSAWTHVFADTIRSVAVLIAGALSYFGDLITPSVADASAAIFVSLVIFLSCIPLIKGLLKTFHEIAVMRESALLMEI